ncbi:MAG: hypothetical protein KDJ16_17380, partial [Hyphomicrobiales bacterium]|nr:hypothetical protein [Hyphomicrobiales bacterium]
MSDRLISKNGLGKDEGKPNGAAGEGIGEKSLFDKLDDIMNIANKASAGNADREKAEADKAPTVTAGAVERPAADIKRGRDREIERSFSDALDEIMNGKPKSGNGEATRTNRGSVGDGTSAVTASTGGGFGGSATEAMLYRMLSELKADIDSLKRESDTVKSSAFAAMPVPDHASDDEKYLFGLLSELRSDIDDLKHESHAAGVYAVGAGRARRGGEGEHFAMLSDLRSDITTLKAESEAFMMHSGVAPAGRGAPYAVQQPSAMRPVLIGAFTALAILAAAGGGYFFATMENG